MTSGRVVGTRWLVIALVAALGLTLSVSVAGAGATGSRGAVVAKKKCKKKKGVTSAKKNRVAALPWKAPGLKWTQIRHCHASPPCCHHCGS